MDIQYPDTIAIPHSPDPISATVRVPGSKSITNRAFILAALAENPCTLLHALDCEDTRVMMDSLQTLGIGIDERDTRIRIQPSPGATPFSVERADLFVANSGTSMRFLTALVALGRGRYRLDGIARMRERPIRDLLDALAQLGATLQGESPGGCPPVSVEADGLTGGEVHIKGDISSQYLSALLMVAPSAENDVTIVVDGPLVSVPYVTMTLEMMREFGVDVENQSHERYLVPGRRRYHAPDEYPIEPDASAASYFFGLAALTQGEIRVPNLGRTSLQGDVRFVDVLEQMGCTVDWASETELGEPAIAVRGGELRGIDVDMNDISDTVMTLAVVACFADGPTTIRNVGHIRHKETDRIEALATELRRVGVEVDEREDGLTIHPRPLRPAKLETYNDHRMAMSFSLLGVRSPGIVIDNPSCVQKTYPHFFDDFQRLLRR